MALFLRGSLLTNHRPDWRWPAAIALLISLVSAPAFAAGAVSEESFQAILLLLGVVIVAFAVTHLFSEWISRRYGIVTGVEYVILGALVGPVLGVLNAETLVQMSPAFVLAEGSLGLLAGILLNFRNRTAISARAYGIGLVVTVCTMAAVTGLPLVASFYFLGTQETWDYLTLFLCAGAVASVASSGPLSSLILFLDARGAGTEVALRTARACSSLAVVVFGPIFCLFKPVSELLAGVELGGWESFATWLGLHVALGAVLGLIFTLFLIRDFEDEKILTVVIGMVIFTSGVAYFLQLSPIFVCFVLGLVLANVCRQSDHVRQMLHSVERPLYIVLFFFVGASVSFAVSWIEVAVITTAFLMLRGVGRFTGGILGNRLWSSLRTLPPMGPALLAPGALSAAMLLNFHQVFGEHPHVPELFLALLLAVVFSEPIAHRFTRRWLIDATDVGFGREDSAVVDAADAEEVS